MSAAGAKIDDHVARFRQTQYRLAEVLQLLEFSLQTRRRQGSAVGSRVERDLVPIS